MGKFDKSGWQEGQQKLKEYERWEQRAKFAGLLLLATTGGFLGAHIAYFFSPAIRQVVQYVIAFI